MNDYLYTPATTDITINWKLRHEWIPPSQDPYYIKKWAEFRKKFVIDIEKFNKETLRKS